MFDFFGADGTQGFVYAMEPGFTPEGAMRLELAKGPALVKADGTGAVERMRQE